MLKERSLYAEQEVGHKIWTIVDLFYRSLLVFREQYDSYEAKVQEFAVARNTPRELLRLNSRDLAGLLDFKNLERLRNGYIHELKDLCHSVFRGQDQTDLLDRYVSDIFHQISILKEAYYNVKTYAPFFESSSREQELRGILDEAHEGFPKLTKHIHFLFQQAQSRMEQHLGSFRTIPIFIRSLFVQRDDFVARVYPSGIRQFYRFMYPLGAVEGFYRVGLSFYHAGFAEQARVAFEEALTACGDQIRTGDVRAGTERRRTLQHLLDPLVMKLRRLGSKAFQVDRPCLFAGPVSVASIPSVGGSPLAPGASKRAPGGNRGARSCEVEASRDRRGTVGASKDPSPPPASSPEPGVLGGGSSVPAKPKGSDPSDVGIAARPR